MSKSISDELDNYEKRNESNLEHMVSQVAYIGKLRRQRNFWIATSICLVLILVWEIK